MIKVRINGQVVHLPTLKGVDGKSAYQYALEGGFEGTEQEFINSLVDASNTIYAHMKDESAHEYIRNLINTLQTEVDDKISNSDLVEGNNVTINNDNGKITISSKDTTYNFMQAATATANGKSGLVPTPQAGKQNYFLRGDGTWQMPTDTKYNVATQADDGLMSSADKIKLDSLSTGSSDSTNMVKQIDLSGTCQANYRKTVIALCELSAKDTSTRKFADGRLSLIRKNGGYTPVSIELNVCDPYNTDFVARFSMLEDTSQELNAIRPCTFTYNGTVYAGLDISIGNAGLDEIKFIGNTNFSMFGVDYYDIQNDVVLVEEINNSLEYENTVSRISGLRHNGRTILNANNYKIYCTPANIGAATSDHTHAEYFPSTGGILSGNVNIVKEDTSTTQILLQNSVRKGGLSITGTGTLGLYDSTNSKWILSSDTEGNTTFNGNANTATSAEKLDSSAGSETQPVYFKDGKPVAVTHKLEASVPSDAKFTDTTYNFMQAATATANGKSGLVPTPQAGKQNYFLRGDGTWQMPTDTKYTHPSYTAKDSGLYKVTVDDTGHVSAATAVAKSDITALGIPAQDTTYSNFVKSGTGAKAGLVPAPSTTAGTTKYLREDGQWVTPPTSASYSAGTGLALNGTTFSINKIPDKTTTGGLNFTSEDNGKLIPTNNTLAYWSGCYNADNNKSNLTHCKQGEFGVAATYGVATSVSSGNNNLVTSGAVHNALSNYFPSTGGILSGNVNIVKEDTSTTQILLQNSVRKGGLSITSAGVLGLYDSTNSKWILSSDTTGKAIFNGNANTATSAEKLDSSAGSETQPVYFKDGKPVATTYTLEKSVPSDAKFTDTTYSEFKGSIAGLVPAIEAMTNMPTKYLREDGKWVEPAISGSGNGYVHPSYTAKTNGLYKVTVDNTGHVSEAIAVTKDDITTLGISAQGHTHTEYLPKSTGGTLNGNINIIKSDKSTSQILLANSLRKGTFAVSAEGNIGMFDNTNSKWIFSSTPTGTTTFNGTATAATKLSSSDGDLNHPVYFKDGKPVVCDSNIKSKVNFCTNDKSTSDDGVTGCILAYTGRLHMTGDSTNNPGLTFYYNNSTAKTSAIAESAAGKINIDATDVSVKSTRAIAYSDQTAYGTSLSTKTSGLTFGSTSKVTQLAGKKVSINCADSESFTTNVPLVSASDRRIKTDSEKLDNTSEKYYKYIDMWDKMTPRSYKWLTEEDQENAKFNLGYFADEVEEALYDSGLTNKDFSGVVTMDEYEIYNEDIADFAIIKNFKALSYQDCQMLTTLKVKQVVNELIPGLMNQIDELNKKVETLQAELNSMKGE